MPRGLHLQLFLFLNRCPAQAAVPQTRSKNCKTLTSRGTVHKNRVTGFNSPTKNYTDLVAIVHIFIMEIKHLKFQSHLTQYIIYYYLTLHFLEILLFFYSNVLNGIKVIFSIEICVVFIAKLQLCALH